MFISRTISINVNDLSTHLSAIEVNTKITISSVFVVFIGCSFDCNHGIVLIFVLDRRPDKLWPVRAVYRKIPITSPGLIFVQKAFLLGLFSGSLFLEGLIIGGNFAFQNGLDLTMKTVSTNSPWAYIWEGLLSEGYLRLRFGGLIFGRTYFGGGGGGGGGLIIGILRYFNSILCFSDRMSKRHFPTSLTTP